MTQEELNKAAGIAKDFLATLGGIADESPQPASSDAARLRIALVLFAAGTAAATGSYMLAPVLFIPSFCLFFVGFGLTLVGIIDKWFFPETNTFQLIAEDARATATMFLALVLLVIGGIIAGAAIVQIPASTAEEVGAVVHQSAGEPRGQVPQLQEKPPAPIDSAGHRYSGTPEGEQ